MGHERADGLGRRGVERAATGGSRPHAGRGDRLHDRGRLVFHRFAQLGAAPVLTRALALGYDEDPVASRLVSAQLTGFGEMDSITLPPRTFTYSPRTIRPIGVPDGESSLVTVWRRAEELLSAGLVPFASAPGGDIYCFRSKGDVVDLVLGDHEAGASHLVAASFQDFLDRLEVAPIATAPDLRRIKSRLDPDLL